MSSAAAGSHGADATPEDASTPACPYCGSATRVDRGRMTLWLGERLVIVEDVPTRICTGCGERFYRDDVLARVERLQAGGTDGPAPVRTMRAPVYAWSDL